MSVDYTRTSGAETPEETESEMFAPTPMWERSKKNRKSSAERRSFFERDDSAEAIPASEAAIGAGATGALVSEPIMERECVRETAMSPTGVDAAFVTPATRTTTVRRERSMAPAAVG